MLLIALQALAYTLEAQLCTNTQLGGTSGCPRSDFYRGEIVPSSGASPLSISPYSPGEYFRMPVLAGGCYTISTCGAPFDTQISCFQGVATTGPFAWNDDSGPLCSGLAASCSMVPSFTDYARIDVRQYSCQPGGSSSITVTVQQNNNLSFTSSAASMCQGQVRALSALPLPVTGEQPNSGPPGVFTGTGVSGNSFTAPVPAGSNQNYTITYTFGYVSTTQSIQVFHAPTTSNAGPNQTICSGSTSLAGNNPSFGTGQWTVQSGSAVVSTPTSPTSSISNLTPGASSVLVWTISNGPCSPSIDSVRITVDQQPTAPNAGSDGVVCSDTIFLAANSPSIGTAVWSVAAGSGIVASSTNPASMVSNLTVGTNAFVWSISNGVCPTQRDTVYYQRDAQAPQPFAGPDKMICEDSTLLTGNIPPLGFGTWALISGSGVVTSPNSPNSLLDNINVGSSVLTWTITNGSCPPRSDTMVVTRNPLPGSPNISGNNTVCYGASATLTATSTASSPVYLWWDAPVAGNLLSAGSSYVTPPITSPVTVYAEVTDGSTNCASQRTQFVVTPAPLPTVTLGADTTICSSDTLCLDAGAGMSSYQWNTGATSRVLCTNSPGMYWVQVEDANGCHAFDTVNVAVNTAPTVSLGPDFTLCNGAQQVIGVQSQTGLSYNWSNGATTSQITVSQAGTYVLTVSDQIGCNASDEVTVGVQSTPQAAFTIDMTDCPDIHFVDQSTGTTTWSWSFGNGLSGTTQNPSHNYLTSGNGLYTVSLISSGPCGADTSQQTVDINCIVGISLPSDLMVTVYPNPNDGEFKIHFEGLDDLCTLQVVNELGQLIYAKDITACGGACDELVNIRGVSRGVYFARMRIGDLKVTKRILVH